MPPLVSLCLLSIILVSWIPVRNYNPCLHYYLLSPCVSVFIQPSSFWMLINHIGLGAHLTAI